VSRSVRFLLIAALLAPAALPTRGAAQARMDFPPLYPANAPRPSVVVVGTAHLANNNRDMNNAQFDDVLSPRRQGELDALAVGLSRFRATKIAVEVPVERQPWLDSLYQAYLRGEVTDNRNEIVQIGFRLARRMGHTRVYAVDWKHDMNIGAVMQWAATHGQGARAQQMGGWGRELMARMNPAIARMTITEMLLEANRPENLVIGHQGYLLEARIGADSTYPGWEDVAGWYGRNLRIFANVGRIVEAPTDRVLVLFGAGHAPLLNHYFEGAGDFEVVRVGSILR
jgi:uncharacterized protein DUF5694